MTDELWIKDFEKLGKIDKRVYRTLQALFVELTDEFPELTLFQFTTIVLEQLSNGVEIAIENKRRGLI